MAMARRERMLNPSEAEPWWKRWGWNLAVLILLPLLPLIAIGFVAVMMHSKLNELIRSGQWLTALVCFLLVGVFADLTFLYAIYQYAKGVEYLTSTHYLEGF